MADFKQGMIVRIYCEKFLTYDRIECYPNSKLNMIVGPNGTGKSSLVNAIVLGLGGKLAVIGRAKQLPAFIKRGYDTAKIEIELYNEPVNYIIGRKFDNQNKNHWTVNGETVTFKQVETIIKMMNIQVDNLCQFLPQDRVQDFAKMDSKQLLENTLKTVGSNEVVELHTSLKDLRVQELTLGTKMKSSKQQLDSEKMKVARLETEVSAIREREEMLKSIEMINKKKVWIEFEEVEKRQKEILDDRKRITEMKTAAEENLQPFEEDIINTKEDIKKIDKNMSKEIRLCGENSSDIKHSFDVVTNADDKVHSIKNEYKRKLEAEKKRESKLNALHEEINNLESSVNPTKENQISQQVNEIQLQLSNKNKKVSEIYNKTKETDEKLSEINRTKLRMEGALERELSAANKKVQILAQRFRDAHQAYEWLKENRGKFRGHIYGPMMLEINCQDELAKFVEFKVSPRDLCAFLCEDSNDMNELLKTVRDEMGFRINVVQATDNCNSPVTDNFQPPRPIQQIKQFGFWTYVIDQVQGPNPVLNYLCKNYGLHRTPIGNKQTNNMTDRIPKEITSYFSDTDFYNVRISKYSGETSSQMVNVRPAVLLAGSTNTSLIGEYQRNIEKEINKLNSIKAASDELKSKMSSLERQRDELRGQKRILEQELLNLRTGRSKLKMKREELELYLKEGKFDKEVEEAKTKQKIKSVLDNVCSLQKKGLIHFKNYQGSLSKNLLNKLKLTKSQEILKKKQQASMEASKKVEECRKMLTNVENDLRIIHRDVKRVQERALSMTEHLSPKDASFKRKYSEAFSKLPQELEALDAEISKLTARADCLVGGRISILEEYEKTKKLIEELEKSIANPELKLQALKDEMTEKKERWIPQVLDLVGRINKNFTEYFKQMKCVGEVSLEVPDDKDEYSKYGICIKVQFRESGKLQQLGPYTQSGGERAVSTAIYMLSLQELTTVPFRCVDEINQGMDEFNERLVFTLMVNTMEKADSAQCFLLTPKVLHHLEYKRHVKSLCVYSGERSTSYLEFDRKYYEATKEAYKRSKSKIERGSLKRKSSERDMFDSESNSSGSDTL